jgi:hypothetical protein
METSALFKLKKEIGVSDLIAFVALIVSIWALYISYDSNRAFIVQGGGVIKENIIQGGNKKCGLIVTMPISFSNSGKQATTLEQLAPTDNLPAVIFSDGDKLLTDMKLPYKQYLLSTLENADKGVTLSELTSNKEFIPSFNHIGDLIEPNQTYKLNYMLLVPTDANLNSFKNPKAFVSFDANFSNGQILKIRSAFDLALSSRVICS